MFDEMFFHIACKFVEVKLHELMSRHETKQHKQEVIDTIKLASVVSTQRSYADLILKMKKLIPDYLGFEGLGILFRDTKTDKLFTVQDTYKDEDLALAEVVDEKLKRGETLTE